MRNLSGLAALTALLALLTCAAPTRAVQTAYEPFNYSAGTIVGDNGGTGFSGAWTGGANTVTTPGATYTDSNSQVLLVGGNKISLVGSNVGSFRGVTGAPTSGSLYVSFIAKADTAGTGYEGLSLYTGTTTEQLFLGQPNAQTNWGIDPKGGTVATSSSSTLNQAFLVYRVDFGTTPTIRLYVNPTLAAEPGAADATATKTANFSWDSIRVQSGAAAGNTGLFDEIRIGTTYADVTTPEPASFGMLTIGAFGLLARRRKSAVV